MIACDKCGAMISRSSKYCPQCGDPVTDEDTKVIAPTDKTPAIVSITFGYSTSSNYSSAISICSNIESYSTKGEGRDAIHSVTLPITEVELIVRIFDLVGSWSSSRMLIDGRSATKKDLTYYGVGCYRNRQKAFRPQQYCFGEKEYEFNIWGCKRLNMPISPWGGGWLDYGSFDDRGVWYFEKDRIKHDLEIGLAENALCPVLDRKKVIETLDGLPEKIEVPRSKSWQYRTNYEKIEGNFQEVAVGIRPVMGSVNKFVVGTYRPQWSQESSDDVEIKIKIDDAEISSKRKIPLNNKAPQSADAPKKKGKLLRALRNLLFVVIGIIILLIILTVAFSNGG